MNGCQMLDVVGGSDMMNMLREAELEGLKKPQRCLAKRGTWKEKTALPGAKTGEGTQKTEKKIQQTEKMNKYAILSWKKIEFAFGMMAETEPAF